VADSATSSSALSPFQARTAFGTYLSRIQGRLMLDSELREDVTSTQHMQLLMRFLKRAGLNLSPSFRVEIPSRRLPVYDQKRILAKQLADFLHHYQKETVASCSSTHSFTGQFIDPSLFDRFLRSAAETDLEQIMINYMKTNGQSSIHLGVQPKTGKTGDQSTDLSDLVFGEPTVWSHTNDEPTTMANRRKPLVRSGSAQLHNDRNNKRQEDIYRVYSVARPLSAGKATRKRTLVVV
jgi:hypothetical protein